MPKEEALTAHGEVEYETIECATCGNKEMKKKSQQFLLGDIKKKYDWKGHDEFHVYDGYITGHLCEYCADAETINIDREEMRPSGGIRGLLSGIRNAHGEYTSKMIHHLNGEFGGNDGDIIHGLFMLAGYLGMVSILIGVTLPLIL